MQKQLCALQRNERADVVLKLLKLADVFGQPRRHAGLGIRKLRGDLFECQMGLARRVHFRALSDALLIRFIGSHEEVQKYLRKN